MHILAEACRISSCTLLCGEGHDADVKTQSLMANTLQTLSAACLTNSASTLSKQVLLFDLAQTTSSWALSWSTLLGDALSQSLSDCILAKVPILKGIDWNDDTPNFRSYLPFVPENASSKSGETASVQQSAEKEKDLEGEGDKRPAALSVDTINRFMDGNAEGGHGMLDESFDAFSLQTGDFDATFLNLLQSRLQSTVWACYGAHLRQCMPARQVQIDLSKKGSDAVLISKALAKSAGFEMYLAGAVSTCPQGQLGKDHYPLCTLLGVTFYVNGPKDMSSFDAVVPGWLSKTVSRNDLAYFQLGSESKKFVMYLSGGDAGLQIQSVDEINDTFRAALDIKPSYTCATPGEQEAISKSYQQFMDGDNADIGDAWQNQEHWRSQSRLAGLVVFALC